MFPIYRLDERSIFSPGAGKVVGSEYESVSVVLKKELTSEAGTVTITAPGGVVAGAEYFVNVVFRTILNNSYLEKFQADINETIRVVLPSPLPSNPANWIADYIRRHPAFASSCAATVAANVITYKIVRPGVNLAISSATANLVAKAVTTAAANGGISNIGDGQAIFYRHQDNLIESVTTKNLFGYSGFSSVTPSPLPLFLGVRRAHDKLQDSTIASLIASPRTEDCCEVIRRGTVHIPLEANAATNIANNLLGVIARFAVAPGFTNVGGYQIIPSNTDPLPAGTLLIPRCEVLGIASDRRSAVIRLV